MAKYKPTINDEINFTKDDKTWCGTIKWVAESGFVVVYPHNKPIMDWSGKPLDCDVVVESREIIGLKR